MTREKDLTIETLRGIAILLVVTGHIVRHDIRPIFEMQPGWSAGFLVYLEKALSVIRLPLFTVISAYLYAASPAMKETFSKLIRGKFRRIFVPFLTLTAIQFLLLDAGSAAAFLKAYLWPLHHMWFLFSIFNIFILVGCLDAAGALKEFKSYAALCAAAMAVHVIAPLPGIFSIYGTNYLLPFFLLGYGLRRFPEHFSASRHLTLLAVVFAAAFAVKPVYYHFFQADLPFHVRRAVGLIAAFSGIPLIFHFRRPVPALAFFGYYAFGIYLFHRLSIAAVDNLFEAAGWHDPIIVFSAYTAGGIFLAVIMQKFFEMSAWGRVFVLGVKPGSQKQAGENPVCAGNPPAITPPLMVSERI